MIAYDDHTCSQLQTDQKFPTLGNKIDGIRANADGYYDIYCAPEPPKGMEGNCLQTMSGKSWWIFLRMWVPLLACIDKAWRPCEIELLNQGSD